MMNPPLLKELAAKPAINYWMGPDGHAVCYLYNIVLACADNLPEMVNMAKADVQEMRDPQLLAPLDLFQNSEEMKVWSHLKGHFALLGDACHATLPYLAQGAVMAIEDGAVLSDLSAESHAPAKLTDLLILYEAIRNRQRLDLPA